MRDSPHFAILGGGIRKLGESLKRGFPSCFYAKG